MATISSSSSAAQLLAKPAAPSPAGTTAAAASKTLSSAQSPAVIIGISDAAKAATDRLAAARAALDDIPKSLDEIVARKTEAFTAKLLKGLEGARVRIDETIGLHVDRFGNVTADGPQRKKVEKYFQDNPDMAKEFKDIAALQELKAATEVLRLYVEQKKAALSEDERDKARDLFNLRSMRVHELSGFFSLKDGKLISAANEYADALRTPEEKARLAAQNKSVTPAAPAGRTDLLV